MRHLLKADEPGILAAIAPFALHSYPADVLDGVAVPNPSEVVRAEVGTASVAEAAALHHGGAGAELVVEKIKGDAELRRASIVVGLDQYVDQVRHLLRPGTELRISGLGDEEQRAADAVALAAKGHAVALIGSGDAGIYAMASPALEGAGADIDVVGVPGVHAHHRGRGLLHDPDGRGADGHAARISLELSGISQVSSSSWP